MNGSHSQCMQLIFSGIIFEDLKEVTVPFQGSDIVMINSAWGTVK